MMIGIERVQHGNVGGDMKEAYSNNNNRHNKNNNCNQASEDEDDDGEEEDEDDDDDEEYDEEEDEDESDGGDEEEESEDEEDEPIVFVRDVPLLRLENVTQQTRQFITRDGRIIDVENHSKQQPRKGLFGGWFRRNNNNFRNSNAILLPPPKPAIELPKVNDQGDEISLGKSAHDDDENNEEDEEDEEEEEEGEEDEDEEEGEEDEEEAEAEPVVSEVGGRGNNIELAGSKHRPICDQESSIISNSLIRDDAVKKNLNGDSSESSNDSNETRENVLLDGDSIRRIDNDNEFAAAETKLVHGSRPHPADEQPVWNRGLEDNNEQSEGSQATLNASTTSKSLHLDNSATSLQLSEIQAKFPQDDTSKAVELVEAPSDHGDSLRNAEERQDEDEEYDDYGDNDDEEHDEDCDEKYNVVETKYYEETEKADDDEEEFNEVVGTSSTFGQNSASNHGHDRKSSAVSNVPKWIDSSIAKDRWDNNGSETSEESNQFRETEYNNGAEQNNDDETDSEEELDSKGFQVTNRPSFDSWGHQSNTLDSLHSDSNANDRRAPEIQSSLTRQSIYVATQPEDASSNSIKSGKETENENAEQGYYYKEDVDERDYDYYDDNELDDDIEQVDSKIIEEPEEAEEYVGEVDEVLSSPCERTASKLSPYHDQEIKMLPKAPCWADNDNDGSSASEESSRIRDRNFDEDHIKNDYDDEHADEAEFLVDTQPAVAEQHSWGSAQPGGHETWSTTRGMSKPFHPTGSAACLRFPNKEAKLSQDNISDSSHFDEVPSDRRTSLHNANRSEEGRDEDEEGSLDDLCLFSGNSALKSNLDHELRNGSLQPDNVEESLSNEGIETLEENIRIRVKELNRDHLGDLIGRVNDDETVTESESVVASMENLSANQHSCGSWGLQYDNEQADGSEASSRGMTSPKPAVVGSSAAICQQFPEVAKAISSVEAPPDRIAQEKLPEPTGDETIRSNNLRASENQKTKTMAGLLSLFSRSRQVGNPKIGSPSASLEASDPKQSDAELGDNTSKHDEGITEQAHQLEKPMDEQDGAISKLNPLEANGTTDELGHTRTSNVDKASPPIETDVSVPIVKPKKKLLKKKPSKVVSKGQNEASNKGENSQPEATSFAPQGILEPPAEAEATTAAQALGNFEDETPQEGSEIVTPSPSKKKKVGKKPLPGKKKKKGKKSSVNFDGAPQTPSANEVSLDGFLSPSADSPSLNALFKKMTKQKKFTTHGDEISVGTFGTVKTMKSHKPVLRAEKEKALISTNVDSIFDETGKERRPWESKKSYKSGTVLQNMPINDSIEEEETSQTEGVVEDEGMHEIKFVGVDTLESNEANVVDVVPLPEFESTLDDMFDEDDSFEQEIKIVLEAERNFNLDSPRNMKVSNQPDFEVAWKEVAEKNSQTEKDREPKETDAAKTPKMTEEEATKVPLSLAIFQSPILPIVAAGDAAGGASQKKGRPKKEKKRITNSSTKKRRPPKVKEEGEKDYVAFFMSKLNAETNESTESQPPGDATSAVISPLMKSASNVLTRKLLKDGDLLDRKSRSEHKTTLKKKTKKVPEKPKSEVERKRRPRSNSLPGVNANESGSASIGSKSSSRGSKKSGSDGIAALDLLRKAGFSADETKHSDAAKEYALELKKREKKLTTVASLKQEMQDVRKGGIAPTGKPLKQTKKLTRRASFRQASSFKATPEQTNFFGFEPEESTRRNSFSAVNFFGGQPMSNDSTRSHSEANDCLFQSFDWNDDTQSPSKIEVQKKDKREKKKKKAVLGVANPLTSLFLGGKEP